MEEADVEFLLEKLVSEEKNQISGGAPLPHSPFLSLSAWNFLIFNPHHCLSLPSLLYLSLLYFPGISLFPGPVLWAPSFSSLSFSFLLYPAIYFWKSKAFVVRLTYLIVLCYLFLTYKTEELKLFSFSLKKRKAVSSKQRDVFWNIILDEFYGRIRDSPEKKTSSLPLWEGSRGGVGVFLAETEGRLLLSLSFQGRQALSWDEITQRAQQGAKK